MVVMLWLVTNNIVLSQKIKLLLIMNSIEKRLKPHSYCKSALHVLEYVMDC